MKDCQNRPQDMTVEQWCDTKGIIDTIRGAQSSAIIYSTKVAFLFSLTIEFLQLFLRLGTFQLSDLCYNTLGGAMGGVLYWMGWKIQKRKR